METYEQARKRILRDLRLRGWKIKDSLKVPQAIPPSSDSDRPPFVLFFTPQAVKMNEHSMFCDIRSMAVDSFLRLVKQCADSRGIFW